MPQSREYKTEKPYQHEERTHYESKYGRGHQDTHLPSHMTSQHGVPLFESQIHPQAHYQQRVPQQAGHSHFEAPHYLHHDPSFAHLPPKNPSPVHQQQYQDYHTPSPVHTPSPMHNQHQQGYFQQPAFFPQASHHQYQQGQYQQNQFQHASPQAPPHRQAGAHQPAYQQSSQMNHPSSPHHAQPQRQQQPQQSFFSNATPLGASFPPPPQYQYSEPGTPSISRTN